MVPYLDEHFNGEHDCENIIGSGQKDAFGAVWWYVGAFHRQGDAVQGNEHEDCVIEPLLFY
jgi:hypothetical protein